MYLFLDKGVRFATGKLNQLSDLSTEIETIKILTKQL
jgi:hypothetical protein